MWIDRRKRHSITFKVDSYELQIIKDIAEALGESRGEAVRRALWVFRILYDKDLLLKDAVKEVDPNKALCDILKPIPELSAQLGLDIKIWRASQSSSKVHHKA